MRGGQGGRSVHIHQFGSIGDGLYRLGRMQSGGVVHHWSLVSLAEVEGNGEEGREHTSGSMSFPAGPATLAVAAAWRQLGLARGADNSRSWVGEEVDALAGLLTQMDVEGYP